MFDEAELSSWETSGLLCSRSLDYGFKVVPSRRTVFDEAEPSSDCSRNLDYRVQGLAPGAELSVDIAGELLYNIDRLMSGNYLNVVDWKGLLV